MYLVKPFLILASGECGLTVERWTKEYLEKINIRYWRVYIKTFSFHVFHSCSNNTDQVVLLGARCLISPSIPTMIVHHPQEDYKVHLYLIVDDTVIPCIVFITCLHTLP